MRKERTIKAIKRAQKYCRDKTYCLGSCPYNTFCNILINSTGRTPDLLCASYDIYYKNILKYFSK